MTLLNNILLTGGAGFIGSHIAKKLTLSGYKVICYDNLERSSPTFHNYGILEVGDIRDEVKLKKLFNNYNFKAVINCAAYAYVGESTFFPEKYWSNNVGGLASLLGVMKEFGCLFIVHASSCSVYGNGSVNPISESNSLIPTNVYGSTKKQCEALLEHSSATSDLSFISLRFFNVFGNSPDLEIGEDHNPETHLIPLVIKRVLDGGMLEINGNDYPTPDGSAVRDYVDVNDLAGAVELSLKYLLDNCKSQLINIGSGTGRSIYEIIALIEKSLNKKCITTVLNRREGDPPSVVANITKAKLIINWFPKTHFNESIDNMIRRQMNF
jgi:UDP-glucose-4-epimerase GalE